MIGAVIRDQMAADHLCQRLFDFSRTDMIDRDRVWCPYFQQGS